MIPFYFMYDKTDIDKKKIVERYMRMNLNKRRLFAQKQLDEWCRKYLQKEDGEYTFKDIITASPHELTTLKKYMDEHFTDFQQYNKELRFNLSTKQIDFSCNNYVISYLFEKMNKDAKKLLIESLNNRVCPYCNRNYVFSVDYVNTCQLDHFYNKSKYPILAASFYNLIPVCSVCNLKKSAKDFLFNPHINQDEMFRFSYSIKGADFYKNEDSIDIEIIPNDEKYQEQIDDLQLKKIYQGHKDIVLDIAQKHRIFSDEYLQSIKEEFGFHDSVQTLKELIYNVPLDSEKRNTRPLSKLTQDILEEMESI